LTGGFDWGKTELSRLIRFPGFGRVISPASSGVFAVWVLVSPEGLQGHRCESPVTSEVAEKIDSGEAEVCGRRKNTRKRAARGFMPLALSVGYFVQENYSCLCYNKDDS
jgi:hypothetical protein